MATITARTESNASQESTDPHTPTSWIAFATLPILLGAFLQRWGQIVYLTRLDRIFDPFTMTTRSFDLWNPFWDFGAVQFQQNGYWLPFDIWFGFAKTLHIPPWISERLFIYTFISIALWGFVRLADEFKIGRPSTRVAAGFAYAISPVILSRVGWQSPFAMGAVFLPWALLPLVRASKYGSTRKGAALSAIAIALIGGANAAVTIAVLPVPLLYLLTRSRGPRRSSLLRWWFLAIPMATFWWLVGLYLFGKYGPDVLRYTESVGTTTEPTPIFEVLRGTADWVSRLPGDANPAGFALSLRTVPILATSVIAGVGIAGLCRRRLPERSFLLTTFLFGVAAVGGGHSGLFGNPASSQYRTLLSGALNAFRNVYKFQALIALPLAFGVAHLLAGVLDLKLVKTKTFVKRVLAGTILVLLACASWPLWRNSLTRGPGFTEIPSAWIEANAWLSENSPGRTLVLPGIPDADFEWGFTAQIPIQWGSNVTWATRSQAPLSGINIIEYLDATETAIERGGDNGLVEYLRRGGFTTVVVPNDQRSEANGAPPPETIRNAMIASGFTIVASFGESGYGYGDLRQVDVYAVPGGAVAATYPASTTTWLSGDIGSTLSVPPSLFGERPYLLVRDHISTSLQPSQWIITDGNQATTIDYGLNRDNVSYIHGSADDDIPPGQRSSDRTVQEIAGFSSVTASSVGPGIILSNIPAFGPAKVLDGDRNTWWVPHREQVEGPETWGNVDPSIDLTFAQPTLLDHLDISLYLGPFAQPAPIDVTVRTDSGSRTTQVFAVTTPQALDVAKGITNSVHVSIARSSYAAIDDAIGIRELSVPGTPVLPRLVVPDQLATQFQEPGSPDPAWVFTRNRPPTSPVSNVNVENQISRGFTVPKAGSFSLLASAASTRDQRLLDWLGTTPTFSITADSTWGNNPKVGPRNLVDGTTTTPWRSGNDITALGGSSLVSMKWNVPRTISSMKLLRTQADAAPTDVVIYAGNEARGAPVAADGTVEFAPLTTDRISIRINYAPVPLDDTTSSKQMGFTSISIPAIEDLYPGPVDRNAPYVAACGLGPAVTVNGATLAYSVSTTTGALLDGTPFTLIPCDSNNVSLTAGASLLNATSGTSLATIDQLVLGNPPTLAKPAETARPFTLGTWGSSHRSAMIDGGSEGLFVVNEAFNNGWKATLNGTHLTPILIDGWRQGFIVPTGDGGTLQLHYAPDRVFKFGTSAGLVALLAVFVMALWPDRKKREFAPLTTGQPAKALLIGGVAIGAVWSTGVGAILLLPAWWLRSHRRSWLAPIAFIAMSSAGVLAVIGKRMVETPNHLWGAASYPVSALSAVAFLCALVTLLPKRASTNTEPQAQN